jgi:hypothetical protein
MAAMFLDVTERKQCSRTALPAHLLGNIINSMPSVLIGVDQTQGLSVEFTALQINGIKQHKPLVNHWPGFIQLSNQIDNIHKAIRKKQTYSTARNSIAWRRHWPPGYHHLSSVTNGTKEP